MDSAPSHQSATKSDFERLLEIINTTEEIEIQTKLFSIISIYLVSDGIHSDLIITNSIIYDKIYNVLSRCLPSKSTITLNFVSAMLCDSEDRGLTKRQSLIQYARNMIRVSGCLTLMCDLFINCMMHQETWKALCRCLAEVCRNSHENQNYCAHLIPTGVRRCCDGDIDAALVLQSLLHKHVRNVQMFILCNGLSIFNRQRLQVSACLHLLHAVTQNSVATKQLKVVSNCEEILRDFIKLYGAESRLGQWAIIILHNINLLTNDLTKKEEKDESFKNLETLIRREVIPTKRKPNFNDTSKLLHNIRNELLQCKSSYENNIDKIILNRNTLFHENQKLKNRPKMQTQNIPTNAFKIMNSQNMNYLHSNYINDTSFSFLLEPNFCKSTKEYEDEEEISKKYRNMNGKMRENTTNLVDQTKNNNINLHNDLIKNTHSINISTNQMFNESNLNKSNTLGNELSVIDFKPTIVSTPKKVESKIKMNGLQNKRLANKFKRNIKYEKQKRKYYKNVRNVYETEVKHRSSISGRLFGAINNSCTMLVKTVKNIFQSKKNSEELQKTEDETLSENFNTKKGACSFSFTNYMRRRDAILGSKLSIENSVPSSISAEINESSRLCETCNDTVALKNKLVNDDHLKRTVKKLKLGINVYGCDFKKISAALWPRETYMTPNVLYNLYRKLIVK